MVGCRHDWRMLTFVDLVEHVTVLSKGKRMNMVQVTDCKTHLIQARTAKG